MYEVKTEQFSGPMHKLLQLIEQKQMEITKVSLAAVTADFIRYVEELEANSRMMNEAQIPRYARNDRGGEIASPAEGGFAMTEGRINAELLSDFVVIASRLLLIKSKVLLPNLELTEEEEKDIDDLERRLKIYREMQEAGGIIQSLWQRKKIAFSRKFLASLGDTTFFYPAKNANGQALEKSMQSMLKVIEDLLPKEESVTLKVVSLQDKIEDLTSRLAQAQTMSLKGSFTEEERQEVVVLFLAVLHMLANRMVDVEQAGEFGEISLHRAT